MSRSRLSASRRRLATLSLVPALLLAHAGVLLTPPSAMASSVVHLTPEHVLAQADVIFRGTVVSMSYGWTDDRHVFAKTEYVIRVDGSLLDRDGWLAGRTADGTTTLSFSGGVQNGVRYNVAGMPTMAVGESAFFFMSGEDLRNHAMSPVIGLSEGLFRIAPLNGEWKVFTPGGCGGPPRPVDFRFFSKLRDPQISYTPDEFAAEIVRALPLTAASPELRITQSAPIPPHLQGRAFTGEGLANTVAPAGFQPPPGPSVAPDAPPSAHVKPLAPAQRSFAPATLEPIVRPEGLEFGFHSGSPFPPVIFNVPPGTTWHDAFINQQGEWNRYSSGFFQFYVNSNSSVGWPNERNETGFLNNSQMVLLYGQDNAWNANTLAVCISRSDEGRIIEADIAFNPAFTFTLDPNVTYADGNNFFYFQQVALHELGHAFGRQHQWDSDPAASFPSTMNYFTNGFYQAEAGRVFADDAESIRFLVPSTPVALTDFGIQLWRNSATLVSDGGTPPSNINGVTGLNMPASVLQGQFFSISDAYLENVGTVSRATTIDWFLDPTPHDFNLADAYYCSSTNLGTLNRNSGAALSTFIPAPQDIPPGNYFLCAVLPEVDARIDNDFAWSQNTIRVNFNPAFGAPANDSRSTPQAIGLGTFTGSTQFATNDGTAACGASSTTRDVWFSFVAPYAGAFAIDTCLGTSYDTVLSMELRTSLFNADGSFNRFIYVDAGCNDDAVSVCAGSLRSRLFINNLAAGSILRIRLSGYNGAFGPYTLRTQLDPANDFCANAVPVTAGTYTATLAGATNDMTGTCGQSATTPDVWFRYTWPVGCNSVTFNTIGSNFDTVLEAFNVCSPFAVSRGCNDDCGAVGPSCLTINRGAEERIRIRVSNYGASPLTGTSIILNVSTPAPPHDACAGAQTLGDGDYGFNNTCGSADLLPMPSSCGSSQAESDFWFRYTAPITGQLRVVVSTAFPAAAALYPGFACPGNPDQAIACNIGLPGAALQANVSAGETFLIRLGGSVQPGFGTPIGAGTFSFHTTPPPPPADPADFNDDGEVNPDDLADYIGAYFSLPPDPRADFNGDGEINPDDLADYIGVYFS